MISKETIRTSEEYIKVLQQADAEWEAQSNTPDWTFEVLKDPRLRTRPSERERNLVLLNVLINNENKRTVILKDRGVRDDAREGYVFEKAIVGENKFTEYWNKGVGDE